MTDLHRPPNTAAHPFETILFDLDGTLTDSKEGIVRAVRFALTRMGIPHEPWHNFDSFVGPPLLDSLRGRFGLCDAHAREAVAAYREYYSEIGIFENAVYPGIPEMLGELQSAGKRLVLATAKPTPYAEVILKHFGLDPFFSLVVGANLDGTRLHKEEVIREALAQLPPEARRRVVMVGDREHDVLGARACGMECIAVTYGYGTEEELRAAAPKWTVRTVEELSELLKI